MKNFRLLFAIFALFFAQQLSNAQAQPLAISANRTFGPFFTGQNISIQLSATGGVPSYTWNASYRPRAGENLPPNLSLNSATGVITGNITQTANFSFAVRVTDSQGNSVQTTGSPQSPPPIQIQIAPPLKISGPTTASVQQYQAITPSFTANGGASPYTYSASGLPGNLTINSTSGVVSGTVTAPPGIYSATITVTDNSSRTANTSCNLTITAPPPLVWTVDPAPANGTVFSLYNPNNAPLNAASGGTGNYTYTHVSGLPSGLVFNNATRTISGTPNGTITASTTYNVILSVRDNISGSTANATLKNSTLQTIPITIAPYDLKITGPGNATVQQFNAIASQTFTASGGKTPYTFGVSGLPANLRNSTTTSALVVSGNATGSPGIYPVTITVRDGNNQTANTTCNVTITGIPPFVWVTDPKLPDGTQFTDYNQNLTVSGGVPPYTFVLANGTQLPADLTLNNSTGRISGKPQSAIDNKTFTINASYTVAGNTTTISRNFSLTIKPYGMSISGPSEIEVSRLQLPPSNSFSVIGGTANFTWSVSPPPCCQHHCALIRQDEMLRL